VAGGRGCRSEPGRVVAAALHLDGERQSVAATGLDLGDGALVENFHYLGIEVDDALEMAERTEC